MISAALSAGGPGVIRHGSFQDFRAGTPGNSGANLYVSKAGRVEVINHWDLNKDGFLDLLISNDHDVSETVDAFIYWNQGSGFESLLPELWRDRPLAPVLFRLMDRPAGLTRLPTFGGGRSAIMDLNRDGYPEIVFCNYIHNYPGVRTAFVYWGSPAGYSAGRRTELPTHWAEGVAAADLNGDGYPELVFANQGVEAGADSISPPTPDDAFVYWGSATGFLPERVTRLQTGGAPEVAAGDFNRDGHPDLAFAGGRPQRDRVLIFQGSPDGPRAEPTGTLAVPAPASLRAGDLNQDRYADLVVTVAGQAESIRIDSERDARGGQGEDTAYLFFGGASGLSAKDPIQLPTRQARGAWIADFNGDGSPDLALANSGGDSAVYYGSQGKFSPRQRTLLPTAAASAVAAADLNQDGRLDLVFSNSHDADTYDVPSVIYWGSATGFAPYLRTELVSFGAADVNAADLNGDGRTDVLLVNQYSGKVSGRINSAIFWGNPHFHYSAASMTKLPTAGAYDTTAADFNQDGWPDIAIANSYIDETYLYFGGPDGYSPARRQTLTLGKAFASSAADLNRDGHLDLVFIGNQSKAASQATILWGAPEGFAAGRKTVLPLKTKASLSVSIADLNRDGHLDLLFPDGYFDTVQIVWGREEGYSVANSWVRKMTPGNVKLADLNQDGFLDFVFPGEFDPDRKLATAKTRIYWGTAEGTPSFDHAVEMEGYQSIECAIADLNRDGHLDLVTSNYKSDSTRSLPLFIFWGAAGGDYRNSRRTDLPAESSAGVQVLDLNRDGYPEIVIHNHLKDGHHTIDSYIYWNGPQGFDRNRRSELPTFGPHFSQMVDAGNLYTRRLEEEYVSAPVPLPAGRSPHEIAWEGDEPHGARLEFQVRSAASPESLPQAGWSSLTRGQAASAPLPAWPARHRWLQYKAVFRSPDVGAWPVLRAVEIRLKP